MIFTTDELARIRWQFAFLFGVCGAQRTMVDSLCQMKAGYGTSHPGKGRCKRHAGCSTGVRTVEGLRKATLARLKTGKASKLSKEIFNDEEKKIYTRVLKFLYETYDSIDDLIADQIATIYIYQKCYAKDPIPSSDMILKWATQYKLTPKSKDAESSISINIAQLIQEVHEESAKSD